MSSEIVICHYCKGSGKGLHNEGVCTYCEGSGRLMKITRYEKYGSIVDEATRLLSDEVEGEDDFEVELQKQLTHSGLRKPPIRMKK